MLNGIKSNISSMVRNIADVTGISATIRIAKNNPETTIRLSAVAIAGIGLIPPVNGLALGASMAMIGASFLCSNHTNENIKTKETPEGKQEEPKKPKDLKKFTTYQEEYQKIKISAHTARRIDRFIEEKNDFIERANNPADLYKISAKELLIFFRLLTKDLDTNLLDEETERSVIEKTDKICDHYLQETTICEVHPEFDKISKNNIRDLINLASLSFMHKKDLPNYQADYAKLHANIQNKITIFCNGLPQTTAKEKIYKRDLILYGQKQGIIKTRPS